MTKETINSLVEQHYDKGIVIPKTGPWVEDGKTMSVNALTGLKTLDGRTNREGLRKNYKKQEWLFTDSIMEDIAREEQELENWIHRDELKF